MKRREILAGMVTGALAMTIGIRRSFAASALTDNKDKVVALLKAIETGDSAAVAVINPNQYRQHNLDLGDELAGFVAALKQLPAGSARVHTVRVFQDGDFVFAHTEYNIFGPKIGFDIFRFENGKIVEHWDNLQATATHPNASGHTMIDGPTEASNLDKTEENKLIVQGFVDDILCKRFLDKVPNYIDANTYIQHNPNVSDGRTAMVAAFRKLDATGNPHRYNTIHKVLGEGDFVMTASEGSVSGTPTAFSDLFRVNNGKIVEHWDVLQTIPPRSEWKNKNGKF